MSCVSVRKALDRDSTIATFVRYSGDVHDIG